MLGELASGDEEVIEGGAGLKGKEDIDEALSGIKLYKARIRVLLLFYSFYHRDLRGSNKFFCYEQQGETLLELTERWKLLQNKLYDEEKVCGH